MRDEVRRMLDWVRRWGHEWGVSCPRLSRYREKGYLLPTWVRKITCRRFDWMLQSSSGRKCLMMTGAFNRNVGKLFSELKLVTGTFLPIYTAANWEATETTKNWVQLLRQITPLYFLVCIQSVCQLVYVHVMTIVLFMLYYRCWPDYYWEWATAYWKVCPIAILPFLCNYVHRGNW